MRLPHPRSSRHVALLAAALVACATSPLRVAPQSPAESSPAHPAEPGVAPEDQTAEAAPEAEIDDEGEVAEGAESDEASHTHAHPLDGWTEERLRETAQTDLASLGSISLGQPSAGALVNAVRAEDSPLFKAQNPEGAFGTSETIEYLSAAIRAVHAKFPDSPPLALGHISAKNGGPLRPHISHQSGRDVDISFYYRDGSPWYSRGTRNNLDLPRTWALVRALVTETDVDMILIDQHIQGLLEQHALEAGEDRAWIRGLFHGKGGLKRIVRHAPGHATHLHIRFYNPIAQETGRRVAPLLSDLKLQKLPASFVRYRTKRGDTLGKIAKKFGTSVAAIKSANGLRNSKIRDNRDYRIPVRAKPAQFPGAPLRFPPRRLPPNERPALAAGSPPVSAR